MRIRIGYDLQFGIPAPTPMLLLLHTYPFAYTLTEPEFLTTNQGNVYETFLDRFGNRCTRLVAQPGMLQLTCNTVAEVDGRHDEVDFAAPQIPVQQLPIDVLPFLLASRYCEVDRLTDFAWQTFGNGPTGYARAQAICTWVHHHLTFGYQFARNTRTAYEGYTERLGVCRDFAHLAITLCRCVGIPARYATGYLGDIGVPFNPAPMDFSAWFEVYLGNKWYTLDARHDEPRIGRIVMARGRDATDTALTTSFGPTLLQKFHVWTDEVR